MINNSFSLHFYIFSHYGRILDLWCNSFSLDYFCDLSNLHRNCAPCDFRRNQIQNKPKHIYIIMNSVTYSLKLIFQFKCEKNFIEWKIKWNQKITPTFYLMFPFQWNMVDLFSLLFLWSPGNTNSHFIRITFGSWSTLSVFLFSCVISR